MYFIYLFFKNNPFFLISVALDPPCCVQAFSSCGAGVVIAGASVIAERRSGHLSFSSSSPWAQQLWLIGLTAPWHMGSSQTRIQTHVTPALQGGFLTTGLPGKPKLMSFEWQQFNVSSENFRDFNRVHFWKSYYEPVTVLNARRIMEKSMPLEFISRKAPQTSCK